jgi:hypothetical protein
MAVPAGQISLGGGDPRIDQPASLGGSDPRVDQPAYVRPQHRKPHDPRVTFEEYRYYAQVARAEEDALTKDDIGDTTFFSLILPSKSAKGDVVYTNEPVVAREKTSENGNSNGDGEEKFDRDDPRNVHNMEAHERIDVTNDEWTNASRAMRTATWAAVFYLITTDILGPFNVPYVDSLACTSLKSNIILALQWVRLDGVQELVSTRYSELWQSSKYS